MIKLIAIIACSVFLFSGCLPQEPITEYKKITVEQAKAFIDSEDVVVVDVRTQSEFNEGYIANAILIPDTEIAKKADILLPDKDAKILVYCRSGRRSALASRELIGMGYTNVYDFGGIIDWEYEVMKD